jgi:serine protease Do
LSTLTAIALAAATAVAPAPAPDFTKLVEAVSPVVVNISAAGVVPVDEAPPSDDPGLEPPVPFDESSGSGVIIGADGWILTNNHVVAGASEVLVRLADRRELAARIVGTDPASDLALLKVEAAKLPVAKIGDPAKLKPGEWVLAIGAPFGFEYSVTAGIVSAKGRSIGSEQYVPYIQTDVAVNPGNSGGPLINLRGEVIGLNSQIFSSTGTFNGISFAVPVDLAMDVVGQLRKNGRVVRGWLGLNIQDVTRDLAESFGMSRPAGALVRGLAAEGPAAKAGIQVGDVILEYDAKVLRRSDELPPLVGRTAPGKKVALKVLRSGKPVALNATVGELPPPAPPVVERRSAPADDKLGLGVRDLTAGERAALEVAEGGAVIDAILDGPAADAGLAEGDVLLRVGQTPIVSAAQFVELMSAPPAGRTVAVLVLRDGQTQFLPLRIPPAP